MIGKKSSLITYKIGSLVVLLGIFGLFGSSAFAGLGTPSCAKTQAANSSSVWEGHGYTCENNTPTLTACGTTSNKQSCQKPAAGDTCKRYCCICDQTETTPTCESGFKLNTNTNRCDQIMVPLVGKLTGVTVNATAMDCKTKGQILSGSVCANCPSPQVPNTFGTACETQAEAKCAKDQKVDKCVCDEAAAMKSINGVCKSCDDPDVCCGVKLNTNVPFVGKCIRTDKGVSNSTSTVVTPESAFPTLMAALTKIMTTIILLICFGGILAGGVMIASSGGSTTRATEGKKLIGKVVVAIAVLGASGIILHLINPNFFG